MFGVQQTKLDSPPLKHIGDLNLGNRALKPKVSLLALNVNIKIMYLYVGKPLCYF